MIWKVLLAGLKRAFTLKMYQNVNECVLLIKLKAFICRWVKVQCVTKKNTEQQFYKYIHVKLRQRFCQRSDAHSFIVT